MPREVDTHAPSASLSCSASRRQELAASARSSALHRTRSLQASCPRRMARRLASWNGCSSACRSWSSHLPFAWLVLTRWLHPVGTEPIAGGAADAARRTPRVRTHVEGRMGCRHDHRTHRDGMGEPPDHRAMDRDGDRCRHCDQLGVALFIVPLAWRPLRVTLTWTQAERLPLVGADSLWRRILAGRCDSADRSGRMDRSRTRCACGMACVRRDPRGDYCHDLSQRADEQHGDCRRIPAGRRFARSRHRRIRCCSPSPPPSRRAARS